MPLEQALEAVIEAFNGVADDQQRSTVAKSIVLLAKALVEADRKYRRDVAEHAVLAVGNADDQDDPVKTVQNRVDPFIIAHLENAQAKNANYGPKAPRSNCSSNMRDSAQSKRIPQQDNSADG